MFWIRGTEYTQKEKKRYLITFSLNTIRVCNVFNHIILTTNYGCQVPSLMITFFKVLIIMFNVQCCVENVRI